MKWRCNSRQYLTRLCASTSAPTKESAWSTLVNNRCRFASALAILQGPIAAWVLRASAWTKSIRSNFCQARPRSCNTKWAKRIYSWDSAICKAVTIFLCTFVWSTRRRPNEHRDSLAYKASANTLQSFHHQSIMIPSITSRVITKIWLAKSCFLILRILLSSNRCATITHSTSSLSPRRLQRMLKLNHPEPLHRRHNLQKLSSSSALRRKTLGFPRAQSL